MIGNRLSHVLLPLFIVLALSACSNTQIKSSYIDPELKQLELHGVLVVAVSKVQASRVDFEDAFARTLKRRGIDAIASHTLVPSHNASAEQLIAAAEAANLEAILVTRYLGETTEEVYHPGTIYYDVAPIYGAGRYGGFGGYYGHAYEVAYEQPVWTANVTHTLVSDLYVTATEAHIWQAVSDTIKASSDRKLRNDAIGGLVGNLKDQGLLD